MSPTTGMYTNRNDLLRDIAETEIAIEECQAYLARGHDPESAGQLYALLHNLKLTLKRLIQLYDAL